MINMIVEQKEIDCLNGKVISDEFLPRDSVVKEKRWKARLYIYPYVPFMIDFFLTAIKSYNDKSLKTYTACKDGFESLIIEKNFKGVDNFLNNNEGCVPSVSPAIITNDTFDYLFIKEIESEMFYMFGNDEFIKKVMPVSFETYSLYYEENQDKFKKYECYGEFMKWFWETYPK